MQPQQRKRVLTLAGAAVALGIAAWMAASYFATRQAESRITEILDSYGLRDQVHWSALSANPFGTVKLRGVVLGKPERPDSIVVDRVRISGLQDTAQRKRGQLQLRDIASRDGRSPLADTDLLRAGGASSLPPLHAELQWDMDFKRDAGSVRLVLDQPDALRGEADFEVGGLAALEAVRGGGGVDAAALLGFGGLRMLGKLGGLALHGGRLQVQDQGHVARSIALHKRYAYRLAPDGENPARQRERAFGETMKQQAGQCRKAFGAQASASGCDAAIAFLNGSARRLDLRAEPPRPLAVATAFGLMMRGSQDGLLRQLNLSVRN